MRLPACGCANAQSDTKHGNLAGGKSNQEEDDHRNEAGVSLDRDDPDETHECPQPGNASDGKPNQRCGCADGLIVRPIGGEEHANRTDNNQNNRQYSFHNQKEATDFFTISVILSFFINQR